MLLWNINIQHFLNHSEVKRIKADTGPGKRKVGQKKSPFCLPLSSREQNEDFDGKLNCFSFRLPSGPGQAEREQLFSSESRMAPIGYMPENFSYKETVSTTFYLIRPLATFSWFQSGEGTKNANRKKNRVSFSVSPEMERAGVRQGEVQDIWHIQKLKSHRDDMFIEKKSEDGKTLKGWHVAEPQNPRFVCPLP